jgi:RNA recognition motif-containing protein
MGRKLYVGNLPYSVNEDQLTDMFSEVGQVDSVRVITDKFSGKSKGFGFVEMSTDKAAQDAIILDSSLKSIDEIVAHILDALKDKKLL